MSDRAAHTVIPYKCPSCGHPGRVPVAMAGKATLCLACALPFTVPPPLADPPQTQLLDEVKATLPIGFPPRRRPDGQ
jgi:hypothetical protein